MNRLANFTFRPWRGAGPATRRVLITGGGLAVFLTVVHAAIDTVSSMLTALLPTIQDRFGLSESVLAMLVATLSFSSSMTQPLFGALSDRFGSRLIASLGIILNAVLLSLIGIVPTVPLLLGLLLLGGLGSAAFHPAGTSLARTAGPRNIGLAVSLFGAGGTLGLALGPVIVLSLVSRFGLSFTPWLMIPGVVLGVLTYFVMPPEDHMRHKTQHRFFDLRLFTGPIGLLCVAGILSYIAAVTFSSAMPLWLVRTQGVARDDTLIGWTLAAFSLSAVVGGVTAGALSARVSRQLLVSSTMLLAPLPLLSIFALEPGTLSYFLTVMLAGGLVHASLPLLIVSAQDLAPHARATASGMLMGFATGTAGVLYIAIGSLQERIGLAPAMRISYLALIPAALVAFYVLSRYRTPTDEVPRAVRAGVVCACVQCACTPNAYHDTSPAASSEAHQHQLKG